METMVWCFALYTAFGLISSYQPYGVNINSFFRVEYEDSLFFRRCLCNDLPDHVAL